MGDIFRLSLRSFRGHAVENSFVAQGAPALGRSGAGSLSNSSGDLHSRRHQPQDRLQMAGAISSSWPSRSARSLAPSAPLAHTAFASLGPSHQSVAPPPCALGRQEDSSTAPPKASASAGALCADDPALAQTLWLGAPAPTARAARSSFAAPGPDDRHAAQPSVDGGFQRLVPHARWCAPGTADGARPLQPLWIVSASVAQPGRSARAARDAAAFPRARSARSDPRGQWFAFCRQGSAGFVAAFGVVDAAGYSRRVHPAGPSGRQREPRTISWLLPARSGDQRSRPSSSHAAAFEPLAGPLQPGTSARSTEAADARASLSAPPPRLFRGVGAIEISTCLGSATRAQPWPYQVARSAAIHGPGVRGTNSGTQECAASSLGSVSGSATHRVIARPGPGGLRPARWLRQTPLKV